MHRLPFDVDAFQFHLPASQFFLFAFRAASFSPCLQDVLLINATQPSALQMLYRPHIMSADFPISFLPAAAVAGVNVILAATRY